MPLQDPSGPVDLCALDPCDQDVYSIDDIVMCANGFTCRPITEEENVALEVDDLTRVGLCTESWMFGQGCRIDGSRCGDGLFCSAPTCERANAWITATGFEPNPTNGVCMLPVREGGICDSNVADVNLVGPTHELGCLPCEHGTWCVSNADRGIELNPDERRCVRSCAELGEDACGCDVSTCEEIPNDVTHPITGESLGNQFCTPCFASNGEECDATSPCCDQARGAECRPTEYLGLTADVCCIDHSEPESCGGATFNGGCCAGRRCDPSGACVDCAGEGELEANVGCCPGFSPRAATDGDEAICRACHLGDDACSDEYLHVINSADQIDTVAVNESDLRWFSIDDGTGGKLAATAGDTVRARYRLTDDHRAFLFSTSLEQGVDPGDMAFGGTTPADRFTQLPRASTSGTEMTVNLPDSAMESARVYDIGACSVRVSWSMLANLLALGMNRALTNVPRANPLTPVSVTIAPTLRARPLEPATMPRGLMVPEDDFLIRAAYSSTSIGGCTNQTITVDVRLRVVSTNPMVLTESTDIADQNLEAAQIGCTVMPHDSNYYSCNLLWGVNPDGTINVETGALFWDPGGNDRLSMTNCGPAGLNYHCYMPLGRFDYARGAYVVEEMFVARPARPSVTIPTGQSLGFELIGTQSDLVDPCIIDEYVDGIVDGYLRRSFDRFAGNLSGLLAPFLGSRLQQDYNVPLASIPLCGPPGTPEHFGCWADSAIPYGVQHLCTDDAPDGQWRCNGARVDFRRVHLTPDGIELVLAEDPTDPQFSIMNGLPGLVPPGSPLNIAFDASPPRCDPTRFDTAFSTVAETNSMPTASAFIGPDVGPFELIPMVPICEPTAMDCDGICGEVGTTCDIARRLGLVTGLDGSGRCDEGRCRRP